MLLAVNVRCLIKKFRNFLNSALTKCREEKNTVSQHFLHSLEWFSLSTVVLVNRFFRGWRFRGFVRDDRERRAIRLHQVLCEVEEIFIEIFYILQITFEDEF